MARKGTMKWNASPWIFLLIVLAKRSFLYHVFSPSYIYSGENVCGYITFILFIPSPSCVGYDERSW